MESINNKTKRCDELISYSGICKKCGSPFTITRERKKLTGKNIPSHCSRKCSNSRTHSEETIQKIKSTFIKKYPKKETSKIRNNKLKKPNNKVCKGCGELILSKTAKKYCTSECFCLHSHKQTEQEIINKFKNGDNLIGHNVKTIKSALITMKGHTCSICNGTHWLGNPIPLIMDHIDGRANNNTLENLRLVCGNCDMTLPTYKSKNKNSDRKNRKKYY